MEIYVVVAYDVDYGDFEPQAAEPVAAFASLQEAEEYKVKLEEQFETLNRRCMAYVTEAITVGETPSLEKVLATLIMGGMQKDNLYPTDNEIF